jgi:hypothetical protein
MNKDFTKLNDSKMKGYYFSLFYIYAEFFGETSPDNDGRPQESRKLKKRDIVPAVHAHLRRALDKYPPAAEIKNSSFEATGVIDLDFNPSYVVYNSFHDGPALTVSSFFNVALNPDYMMGTTGFNPNASMFTSWERDLVALISDLDADEPHVECLTDHATLDTVWPNEAEKAPNGVFPFEAVVVPEGWFAQKQPGQLIAIDVQTEDMVVIHRSTMEEPRFYHSIRFVDMDQDGLLDIVTVRSGFHMNPRKPEAFAFSPPVGELVWFRNPGPIAIRNSMEDGSAKGWQDIVLVDGLGPDVYLDAKDMDGDGIPEIVATHYFSGTNNFENTTWGSPSRVTLYGAPQTERWDAVNASDPAAPKPQVADIVMDQGMMFSVEIVDLDGDGRLDVLATNHQTQNDPIDGRVFGIEPPASGRLFEDPWTIHILMDGIRPTDTPPREPNFRMSPGAAKSFRSPHSTLDDDVGKPWIAVSGDQASKAWVLKPAKEAWVFEEELLLDINDYYGEGTTHTPQEDPFGICISSIGTIGVREEEHAVILYVPVFEATDIHIFRSISPVESAAGTTTEEGQETVGSSDDDSGAFPATTVSLIAGGVVLLCLAACADCSWSHWTSRD